jgi:transcriptional regulator with XRE-family HTH domain/tetratricopeptide (TPR) repeat protein
MAAQSDTPFAGLLRQERTGARMTQQDLAEAAGLSERAVSDIERGLVRKPRKETVSLLADALGLEGAGRGAFESAARGHGPAAAGTGSREAGAGAGAAGGSVADARTWLARVVAALDELGVSAARAMVAKWRAGPGLDDAWLPWVEGLIRLTEEGRLRPAAHRPPPASSPGAFYGRDREVAELGGFLDQVRQGRGGVALVLGPAGIGKSRLLVEILAAHPAGIGAEWVALDRGEAGYRGWRRLLAPLWVMLRRTELAPAGLVRHIEILDDILLADDDGDLTGKLFPGEVAAAVAALLDHVAARQPLVLVIDDAHRGGASSDRLLIDVARRVSASGAGIIAALRRDEIEETSPIRPYSDQAGGRAAPDVVVTIDVPPLDAVATAGLIREQTGSEPPPEIVEQVLKRTGGRPHLISFTKLQAPARGAANASAWAVGKLEAEGLRLLEPAIQSRTDEVRDVLYAAALCAAGGYIEPGLVAGVTGRPAHVVERILDAERQRGPILAPQVSAYCFQHDNWIDALITVCPAGHRRALHARCLELLRADPAADPQRLARHAMDAGEALVGAADLGALTRQAADQAVADYAFAAAAEFYAAAAQYSAGADRIDLLIRQADALRFGGRWDEARPVLRLAATLARGLGRPGSEAIALIHLERLTWSYGLHENQLTEQIREVLDRLPPGEVVLRAQVQATLALRLGMAERKYEGEQADFARAALRELPAAGDSPARADILIGIRGGLQDYISPSKLLEYDKAIVDLGIKFRSAFHINEGLFVRVVDLIRGGRLLELPAAVRAYRDFTEQNPAPVVIYGQALIDAMLSLARGEFAAAGEQTAAAAALSQAWGESVAQEALMAQIGWQLYETGQVEGLADVLAGLPGQSVGTFNELTWSLAAGLIHAELGDLGSASRLLSEVAARTDDFADQPRGPSRIGMLAAAAMMLGHPLLRDAFPADASRWARSLVGLLTEHGDAVVLIGWPAVLLGSKHRFTGLAHLAAGQPAQAAEHLTRAVAQNGDFAALQTRTRFDLARALIRQRGSYVQGIAEMADVQRRAGKLGMVNLAAQAAAELDHPHGDER